MSRGKAHTAVNSPDQGVDKLENFTISKSPSGMAVAALARGGRVSLVVDALKALRVGRQEKKVKNAEGGGQRQQQADPAR